MGVLEGIAIKGLTSLTTSLVKKFVDVGWNKVAEEFEASFNNDDLISFCRACDEYVNIRTLYSSQHDVFIDDVYVPLFMSPSNDWDTEYEISNLSFYNAGITNIIGKAGQGKSTFLRKMLINELKTGKAIPVFFELKYINSDDDLLPQLSKWFKRHNLSIKDKGVSRLLKDGYIKLFFDGFDEIHPASHDSALAKIKDLSRSYPKTTIIVTTRPDTLITTEPFISNYMVRELTADNVKQLFMNISNNNEDMTEDAMNQINQYPSIQEITKTPILAILLFITYRRWSKVPDNLADFYKKIFITLLTHHDSLKPGKKIDRGIDIPLNDHQIEDVFGVFCFTTFSENTDSISPREASDYMKEALDSECFDDVCPDNLVDVIKKCTGIICSDGYDNLTFSHKSLQEYYTATYIASQSISDIRTFYKSVKYGDQERKYDAVLSFLSAIDTKNYTNYYYIPCFKEMFEVDNVKPKIEQTNKEIGLTKIFNSISIPFRAPQPKKSEESTEKRGFAIGLRIEINKDVSTFFYSKFLQPIMLGLLRAGIYLDFLQKNEETIQSADPEDELDYPLLTVLESADEDNRENFYRIVENAYEASVEIEHEHLINLLKKKNKPSLLNKVFKKNKDKETTIVAG
ncbi:MAG: NACHT domain-containing protein [Colwellia sp.]